MRDTRGAVVEEDSRGSMLVMMVASPVPTWKSDEEKV